MKSTVAAIDHNKPPYIEIFSFNTRAPLITWLLTKINVKQCPPLNRITLGRHKSDNSNRMIQLANVSCLPGVHVHVMVPAIFDYNKRLIQLTVIPFSGGHCNYNRFCVPFRSNKTSKPIFYFSRRLICVTNSNSPVTRKLLLENYNCYVILSYFMLNGSYVVWRHFWMPLLLDRTLYQILVGRSTRKWPTV